MVAPPHLAAFARGIDRMRRMLPTYRHGTPREEILAELREMRDGFLGDLQREDLGTEEAAEIRGYVVVLERRLRELGAE